MRTRIPWLFSVVCALFLSSPAHAVLVHQWSHQAGDSADQNGYAIAIDGAGNVVVVGSFFGTVDFGGGPLTSAGADDIFVVQYNSAGVHQWSKRFGSTQGDQAFAVTTDASNNVIVTGSFRLTVDFGGGGLVSSGSGDIFVAKFNSAGVHQWSKRYGGTGTDDGLGVTTDASGDVIVTGDFNNTVNFGGGNLVSAGIADGFLAKFDGSGTYLWSWRFGGNNLDSGVCAAVDGSGNVVVTGYFSGTANFGGSNLTSAGAGDIFLAKYDAAGAHQWSFGYGDSGFDLGYFVGLDGAGNIYLTGSFQGTVNFGGGGLASAGAEDICLAKFDPAGAHQWSKRFGSTGSDFPYGLASNAAGDVFVTGSFQGTVNFGGSPLVSAGLDDIFVARFNSGGTHQWSTRFGSAKSDAGYWIALSGSTVALTGTIGGTVTFGGPNLVGAGGADYFVASFTDDQPVPVLVTSFTATARSGAVEVRWNLWSDESLDNLTLYRRDSAHTQPVAIAQGLDRSVRSYIDQGVQPGQTYSYQLSIRTGSGDDIVSPVASVTVPRFTTSLDQNTPNPFRPVTTIEYTLGERSNASIGIYDAAGRLVARLEQGTQGAGTHRVQWNGRDAGGRLAASGVYFYRLEGVPGVAARRMILLK